MASVTTTTPLMFTRVRPRQAEEVERALNTRFEKGEQLAQQWGVPKSGQQSIAKARKNVGKMVATIAFFWQMVLLKMTALNLPEAMRSIARQYPAPGHLFRVRE